MAETTSSYFQILTKGVQSDLNNTEIVDGALRYTTDTGSLYLDVKNSTETKRLKISDIDNSKTEAEILAIIAPLPKVYVSSDTHRAFVSNGLEMVDLAEIQLSLSDLNTDKDSPIWFTDPKEETNDPKYATDLTYNPKNKELKVSNITITKLNGMTVTTSVDTENIHTAEFSFS